MKLLLILPLISCGCTTVYKVDNKGICRAPDGKVVKEADVDPDRFSKFNPNWDPHRFFTFMRGGGGTGGPNSQYRWEIQYAKLNYGGTCYGW
jgi:hypothetical protein